MSNSWLYWAAGVAVGLPGGLILLTEWQQALARKGSHLARPVALLRHYLLPLGALLVLLIEVSQASPKDTGVRVLSTVFGFALMVLLLSGLNATLFQGAPEGTWRKRVPGIFLDVARFLLIGAGLAVIFSYIWGVRIGGLFTALGVTSVVIGLMLQNSVGQIVSGLFMLLEQPFRIGDWLETAAARGRVVEANWRAVHIETGHGLQITPNSVLATTSFTNHSRQAGAHELAIITKFSVADPPDRVCTVLSRIAAALPQLHTGYLPSSVTLGAGEYRTTVGVESPGDDGAAHGTFLRWIWYAARRAELHLDGAHDDFPTIERIERALRTVVAPALRLGLTDQQSLLPYAKLVRYGADEIVQYPGEVPTRLIFLVEGSVRLTAVREDDTLIPVTTLNVGAFLGLTTLTRQPNMSGAYALGEVTAIEFERSHVQHLVMSKPTLLHDLGRVIDERQSKVQQALGPRTADSALPLR